MAFVLTFTLSGQDNMANNIDNSNIALEAYSPVSYLELGLAQRGSKEFKSEFNKVADMEVSVHLEYMRALNLG